MMDGKKLVIYYSFEGNTEFIAKTIAEATGSDLLQLRPVKELDVKGFMKYLWGGHQVFMKQSPLLVLFDKKPADYDVIFIGTPVWAWTYAPALRSFFNSVKLQGKKIALFCCSAGSPGQTIGHMRQALTGNDIIGEMKFVEALAEKEKNSQKVRQWCKDLGL